MRNIENIVEEIQDNKREREDYKEIVRLMSRYYFLTKTKVYKQLVKASE